MDFMSDSIMGVRIFRTFNVIDDSTREALAIVIDISTVLQTHDKCHGERYRMAWQASGHQNGQRPRIHFQSFEWWCKEHEIEIQFIQPGRPMQNGYIERFNRVYREAILDAYLFTDIREVRALIE